MTGMARRTPPALRSGSTGKHERGPATPGAGDSRTLIVGIGASAGGIDAVSQLLRQLPAGTGLALVVIQHLAPRRPSQLGAVLARATAMPVLDAENGMRPEADHVYVIPPGVEMALRDGHFVVAATAKDRKTPRSIDLFLRSLAEEEKNRAIGVVLSGTGSDGTEGLRAIRAEGGVALVEDPASAKFPGMPESAIAAGAADRVLSIEDLARQLAELNGAVYLRSREGH
jgi:two-component system CheB/CheR fusion protein